MSELLDKYYINFLDNKIVILDDFPMNVRNNTLMLIKNHFEELGKDVIYFGNPRKMFISQDDILAVDTCRALLNLKPLWKVIGKRYDIDDMFTLKELEKNEYPRNGYSQLLNYYYSIFNGHDLENLVVIIDLPETGLHTLVQNVFIDDFMETKISKLIVSRYSTFISSTNSTCIKFIDFYKSKVNK